MKIASGLLFLLILWQPLLAEEEPYVVVLGIAQDGGYPHAACKKECCRRAWENPALRRFVSSIAVVDPATKERWLFDATPDFIPQLEALDQIQTPESSPGLAGIFLTHAHIGHYTGLMYLGRESASSKEVRVYAMPRMREFLASNGPWSQLVKLQNISIQPLEEGKTVQVNSRISVTPILVPHRDEFSETVGYIIRGARKSVVYIPDIDKWERWSQEIEKIIAGVDHAFLDGTFYEENEVPGRNMSEIPHPFIAESLQRFKLLPPEERDKIYFIHLNHSNPALQIDSDAVKRVEHEGCHIARQGDRFPLQ